jgi:hypothetical protein
MPTIQRNQLIFCSNGTHVLKDLWHREVIDRQELLDERSSMITGWNGQSAKQVT